MIAPVNIFRDGSISVYVFKCGFDCVCILYFVFCILYFVFCILYLCSSIARAWEGSSEPGRLYRELYEDLGTHFAISTDTRHLSLNRSTGMHFIKICVCVCDSCFIW